MVRSVESSDKILAQLTQFHSITWDVPYSRIVKEPEEVEKRHTPFGSSTSSPVVIPVTTAPEKEALDEKTEAVSSVQEKVEEETPEGTAHPSPFVEPTVDLSATEHITPLYNSSFSSCPFAGVFPRYKNDHVIRPSKEVIALLQSNRFRSPSRVDVADMRSRVHPLLSSH